MAVKATTYQAGIHVPEHELLPPQSCCPLCFAEGPRQPALLVQSNPDVLLLHCKRCRAYSASRMPAEETLRRYYAHYYDGCSGSMRSPASFARHFMNHAGSLLRPESPAILDFGGGAGDLSRAIAVRLLRQGASRVHIDLVDYSSGLSRNDVPQIAIQPHLTLEAVARTDFDIVLASAVLEHIPAPWPVLTRLFAALRRGGVLYARTPTVVALLRLFERFRLPYDFTFPGHVHDLGQDFWEGTIQRLPPEAGEIRILSSRPSIVETAFDRYPFRTLAAYTLKSPWYVWGRRYRLVGGWEVFFQRK
ncbi:MAG: methyltransferase domain-containing protein [Bryobacteraceae bacterium]